MPKSRKFWGRYHDWRIVAFAGVLCFAVTIAAMKIIGAYSVSLTALSIVLAAVAGSLLGVCLVGAFAAWRVQTTSSASRTCGSTSRSTT